MKSKDDNVGLTHKTDQYEVTMEIPPDLPDFHRGILCPDFEWGIGNDTPPSDPITDSEMEHGRKCGYLVAEEFLKFYPEVLENSTRESVFEEIADLYIEAWKKDADLDLRTFHGIHPHE